ncbi:MAG TPA: TlpA disulfide reductase family protein [Acidimicrobiia bacterium]
MRWMLALMLAITACAGASSGTTVTVGPGTTTVTPTTSLASTTTPQPGAGSDKPTATTVLRSLAPDFSLVLNDGETFTLSEATGPVYLVFWAEWCPVCRLELPMVDRVAADYAGRVEFVGPVWKSGLDATIRAAEELLPSGVIRWGLDPDEVIFELYGVPYQPVTVLIASDQTVVEAWAGVLSEAEIRQALDDLIALSG